ncbi:MAG: bifunctional precorrin-2 dehydrogenase/sirohydrochlorin ferrochelatase [Deltaproteobacteria bacterium]|nr:bifunctional precorrin-2 dehydrogenase/sirohydrochlorin ferrochelatase [Deltaproteobacteria bacterium]
MRYYPMFLRIEGRPCLVIGGGEVAERKVLSLLKADARVTVISPALTPTLAALADRRQIVHHARRYRPEDLDGAWIAFAATNDEAVHAGIGRDAERAGVPLNVVDRPRLCTFIVPSVIERGELTVAISTGGASPAFARRLREELEQLLGPEYAQALAILRAVRRQLQSEARPQPERQAILTALARSGIVDLLRTQQSAAIDRLLRTTVGDGTSVASLRVNLA